jgi:putative serine protease PepD
MEGSPAAKAGLQDGDVVVRAGGRAVGGRPQLVAAVRAMRPQDPLYLTYMRDGRLRDTTVTLEATDPQLLSQWPTMG